MHYFYTVNLCVLKVDFAENQLRQPKTKQQQNLFLVIIVTKQIIFTHFFCKLYLRQKRKPTQQPAPPPYPSVPSKMGVGKG